MNETLEKIKLLLENKEFIRGIVTLTAINASGFISTYEDSANLDELLIIKKMKERKMIAAPGVLISLLFRDNPPVDHYFVFDIVGINDIKPVILSAGMDIIEDSEDSILFAKRGTSLILSPTNPYIGRNYFWLRTLGGDKIDWENYWCDLTGTRYSGLHAHPSDPVRVVANLLFEHTCANLRVDNMPESIISKSTSLKGLKMEKKKVFISQPMADLTSDTIEHRRQQIADTLESKGYTIGNRCPSSLRPKSSVFSDPHPRHQKIDYLGQSIQQMADCDAVFFAKGWENTRGCMVEWTVAKQYGLEIIYENTL